MLKNIRKQVDAYITLIININHIKNLKSNWFSDFIFFQLLSYVASLLLEYVAQNETTAVCQCFKSVLPQSITFPAMLDIHLTT